MIVSVCFSTMLTGCSSSKEASAVAASNSEESGADSADSISAATDSSADASASESASASAADESTEISFNMDPGNGWKATDSPEPEYAKNFRISYFEDGYKLIALADGSRYLTVPEGKTAPDGIDDDITILGQPINDLYIAASATMCLFDAIDGLGSISYSESEADNCYIENARKAMDDGKIKYAGKYSDPDYEMLLAGKCPLAIESSMILYSPETKEKLEELGIPVMVDQTTTETHPLGRTEWIKVYGALLDKDEEAQKVFDEQTAYLDSLSDIGDTGKKVVYFNINSDGEACTRSSEDYITKMIELAGGEYIMGSAEDPENKKSTLKMEMEQFYSNAADADYIIYNGTIGTAPKTLSDLTTEYPLLKDLKAFKEGNVWCTNKDMYQDILGLGQMISEMHEVFTDNADDSLDYLYKLK